VQGSAGDADSDSRPTRAAARVRQLRTAAGKRVQGGGYDDKAQGSQGRAVRIRD
jgi:hypothetical protein